MFIRSTMVRLAWWLAVAVGASLLLAACGDDDGASRAPDDRASMTTTQQDRDDLPDGADPFDLDPKSFSVDSTNPYWPMQPGMRWTYVETDGDGATLDVVVTVTSETRGIANGITARVVRDTVTDDGEIIEDTLDWYAQDQDGNIWYVGEDTAEFEDGEVASTEGSWEAGVDGALPGVIMPAKPTDDMAYRQEYLKGEAEDNGEILAIDEQVDVRAGHYDDVVITKDWITLEPDVLELKFYAPKVGLVLALGISGGSGREELVKLETVSDEVARAAGTTKLGASYG